MLIRDPKVSIASLALVLFAGACKEKPAALVEPVVFVRDGVISQSQHPGSRALPNGTYLFETPWQPGQTVQVGEAQHVAPLKAQCETLYSIPLGDVGRLIAMGAAPPDTALAFSPDGSRLAIGSYLGDIKIVDAWTGQELASRSLAETMVKFVLWSEDSSTLYAAEQSPDANVYALNPEDLRSKWVYRVADDVQSSAAPPGQDIYGVYSLPAAYGLTVLPGGDLLVSGAHGWNNKEGTRLNRSRIIRLSQDGKVVSKFPKTEAVDALFKHPRLDGEGGLLAVPVTRSSEGPDPKDMPVGGVLLLKTEGLEPLRSFTNEPLKPYFSNASIWEGVDVSGALDSLYMGFGDGRVRVVGLDGSDRFTQDTGAPVMAGKIPIVASIGFGFFHEQSLLFSTSSTIIPYGAASPALRPPSTHPNENAIWSLDLDGNVQWTWSGSQRLQGLHLSDDGAHLLAGAGIRDADERRDLYGIMLFDISADMASKSGEERLEVFCPTEGPVFFRQAMGRQGLVAVTEFPYAKEDGSLSGSYRVTVIR